MKADKQTKTTGGAAHRCVVLVGTYKGDQLLPSIVTKVPPERLRVRESTKQTRNAA